MYYKIHGWKPKGWAWLEDRGRRVLHALQKIRLPEGALHVTIGLMRILLVEDEEKIASFIVRGLKEKKFAVDHAKDGEDALFWLDVNAYDLAILDVMLPKVDGLSVCRRLRAKKNNVPILILSARSHVNERVAGLDAGADDYLVKPFSFAELLARIRALLRRDMEVKDNVLRVADLSLNLLNHDVARAGKAVSLTAKEYALLEYLMRNKEEVVTRTMISEHVWNEEFHSLSNVIDVHVASLRRKVDGGARVKLLHTLRGTGYILKG